MNQTFNFFCIWYDGCFYTENHRRKSDDGSGCPDPLFQLERELSADNEVRNAHEINLGYGKDQELPLFSFSTLEIATSYFAASNKLGEGGFGPVYMVLAFTMIILDFL